MWFTVALQRGCMLYCYAHCYTICSSEHPSCCSTFLSSLCRAVCSSVLCHYSVYLSAWHKTLSATDCRAPGTAAILRYIRCCICLCLAQKYRASEMYLSEEVISHSVRCPPQGEGRSSGPVMQSLWMCWRGGWGVVGRQWLALEVTSAASDASTAAALTQRDFNQQLSFFLFFSICHMEIFWQIPLLLSYFYPKLNYFNLSWQSLGPIMKAY